MRLIWPALPGDARFLVLALEDSESGKIIQVTSVAIEEAAAIRWSVDRPAMVHLLAYDRAPEVVGLALGPLFESDGASGALLPRPSFGARARVEDDTALGWERSEEPSLGLSAFRTEVAAGPSCALDAIAWTDLSTGTAPVAIERSRLVDEDALVLLDDWTLWALSARAARELAAAGAPRITGLHSSLTTTWVADTRGRIGTLSVPTGSSDVDVRWDFELPAPEAVARFDVRTTLAPAGVAALTSSSAVWVSFEGRWRRAFDLAPAPGGAVAGCGAVEMSTKTGTLVIAASAGTPGALAYDPVLETVRPFGSTDADACVVAEDVYPGATAALGTTDGRVLVLTTRGWQTLVTTGRGAPVTALEPFAGGLVFADASGAVGRVDGGGRLCWIEPLFSSGPVVIGSGKEPGEIVAVGVDGGRARGVFLAAQPR